MTWCVPVGLPGGPGLELTLLLEREATCSVNPKEGGAQSTKVGAGAPAPLLIQVSALVPWKEGAPPVCQTLGSVPALLT